MNKMPPDEIVVCSIDIGTNPSIKLNVPNASFRQMLTEAGFTGQETTYTRSFPSESELEEGIIFLIRMGVLFGGGYGWSPCAIAAEIKDRKTLDSCVKSIWWSGPDSYIIDTY